MATKLSRTSSPVEATLSFMSDKWKVLILRDLLTGTKRFGELKKSIGSISQKVLTSNLRAMEEDGLLKREVFAEVPPRVEYTLTDRGRSLEPIIDAMRVWGEAHMAELIIEEEAVLMSAQSRCFNLSSDKSPWNDSNATNGRPNKRVAALSGSFAW